jgi:flavin-dependent thymidylate synthase
MNQPHSHSWDENCGPECPRHDEPPCPTKGCPSPVDHEGDCNVPPERKVVQKWADEAMFTATPIDASTGPQLYLLNMTPDPLGAIAAACKGYEGQFVHDLSEITDEERKRYFEQVQKTHLRAPFEFVHFHFLIEGVTRGFTHQMVRQRTATYVQESTRFAVKEDMPVGLPPSLAGTTSVWREHEAQTMQEIPGYDEGHYLIEEQVADAMVRESEAERQRWAWDMAVDDIASKYQYLIESGVPAEDARGLLPTNLLTRIQYRTDLKSLIEHGGNRLCTQAQFEWRTVFSKIVEAIRNFPTQGGRGSTFLKDSWQYEKIAQVFRPICYLTGKCEFKADFDRKCSIRDRVDKFAEHGVPSSEWDLDQYEIDPSLHHIWPDEWLLDPGAAR